MEDESRIHTIKIYVRKNQKSRTKNVIKAVGCLNIQVKKL